MDYTTPVYAECPACDAPIILALAWKSGKVNALDREPVASGNAAIINQRVTYGSMAEPLSPHITERYMQHFATCPSPDKLRAALARMTRESNDHAKRGSWE